MATWQFNIDIIPKRTLLLMFGWVPNQLSIDCERASDNSDDESNLTSTFWWIGLDLNYDSYQPCFSAFGKLQEWTKETKGLKTYGNADTNDISICYNENTNKIETVGCRLDLRSINNNFVYKVLQLANQFDCMLMDVKGKLFEPSIEELFNAIQSSNAYRFVDNPNRFLDDFSKGIIKLE